MRMTRKYEQSVNFADRSKGYTNPFLNTSLDIQLQPCENIFKYLYKDRFYNYFYITLPVMKCLKNHLLDIT